MNLKRIFQLVAPALGVPPREPLEAFDPKFYKESNTDLSPSLSDAAAAWHFVLHGRDEGRCANASEYIDRLAREFSPLPDDFSPEDYRLLNPDVARLARQDWAASEHYLRYGAKEGRRYYAIDVDLYRSLNGLEHLRSEQELLDHYERHKSRKGYFRSGQDVMNQRGLVGGGRWIEAIRPAEFSALNWAWAGPVADKLQAAYAVLEDGLRRMAPLSFETQFDPVYFREAHPNLAASSDQDLYRYWLFHGLETQMPGSAEERLRRLGLALQSYPAAFDWRSYLKGNRLAKSDRWTALEHFLQQDAPSVLPPLLESETPALFLDAVGKAFAYRNDGYAVRLLSKGATYGALTIAGVQSLGDSLYRLKDWDQAAKIYVDLARAGEANLWTFVNGARALLNIDETNAAIDLLGVASLSIRADARFKGVVSEALERAFGDAMAQARLGYAAGTRAEADVALQARIQTLFDKGVELDPLGATLPPKQKRKVVILANMDLRQCTHYRVEQKAELLDILGYDFEIFHSGNVAAFIDALPGASAAIFYRLPAFLNNIRAIETARVLGITTYYEIDDLIFDDDYPEGLETYGGSISPDEYIGLMSGVPLFREAMRRCDFGLTSTDSLARRMAPHIRSGKVFTLPNGLDSRNTLSLETCTPRLRGSDGEVVVFYGSGTKAHNSDFNDLIGPGLLKLMSINQKVRFVVIGHLVLGSDFDALKHRIRQVSFVPNIQDYWSLLAEANINLAPLHPNSVTDGKSEIKWLEAAAFGIPSIVSNTQTYVETLGHGEDALIAASPDEWAAHLAVLAQAPDLRAHLGEAARTKANTVYSSKANAERLRNALRPAFEAADHIRSRTRTRVGRRRVMLANVFFPPQSIGGATRVVRENLDHFLASPNASAFDFAVATTNEGDPHPYRLRIDAYASAPVFRISTPMEMNMDWRPFDDEAGAAFGRVLDIWRPDLVHFHAAQRLTASAVEACADRAIPYLITPHDAWWVSDYQFLVDEGSAVVKTNDLFETRTPEGVSLGQSWSRRRRLKALLNGAGAVLGVSDIFSRLYSGCGVLNVRSVPNGSRALDRDARQASASGRVRMLHAGGMSAHKGFQLVKAALMQGSFANLELTVVDHSHGDGEVRRETWGEVPVRIVGKVPQDQIIRLYGQHDVLLAPSIWPESFGLVAREALSAGLWVVASDRGAIGEDIEPGRDGFLVDVSSPQALLETFAALNADVPRYTTSPPPRTFRSPEQQGEELLSIYTEFTSVPGKRTTKAGGKSAALARGVIKRPRT